MLKNKIIIVFSLIISGCATPPIDNVQIQNVQTKPNIAIPNPDPLKLNVPVWNVITEKNFQDIVEKYKKQNKIPIFIALDEDNYKKIQENFFNLFTYIEQQNAIINTYKKYYNNK